MSHSHGGRSLRALLPLVLGAALSVQAVGAGAATGDPALELVAVDSSTPGRVTATVSTDAGQVRGILRRESGGSVASTGWFPVEDGVAVVEAETWGMRTSLTYVLEVTSCTGTSTSGCATSSTAFVPTDVAPVVEFSDDRTLTGTDQATASVQDDGGGELIAFYRGPFTGQRLHDGSQVLRLDHGANKVVVARCDDRLGCNYFGITEDYTVDKGYAVGSETYQSLVPDDGPAADTAVDFRVADTVPYTFRGHLLPSAHAPTDGWPEVVAEDLVPVDGGVTIPLDLTPMSHGGYVLVGELSRSTLAGPVVQWALARPPQVDREGPRFQFGSLGAEVFHPVRDGHLDEVSISANYYGTNTVQAALTAVHGETGTEVEVGSVSGDAGVVSTVWDGRTPDGRLAPAGTWEVRFTGVDHLGNRTDAVVGQLRLTHKRVVEMRTVFTVSAQQSRTETGTRRCGRVVRDPGDWRGGLGYRTRPCSNRAYAFTTHELDDVPRGWLGGRVAVSGRGRSAEHRPNMVPREARLVLLSERRQPSRRMLAPEGWYSTRLVRHDASGGDPVEWAVGVDGGAQRYDVHRFRVVFEGRALR